MNLILLLILSLNVGETYSGEVTIDGIGRIALPPGQWLLEYAPEVKTDNPAIYVLKKQGDRLERLTIERYGAGMVHPIGAYFDSIGDLRENGIPVRLFNYKRKGEHDGVDMLRDPFAIVRTGDRVTAQGASYIYTSEVNDPWMSHAIVSDRTDWVLVCVHASPFAISPATVREVFSESSFVGPINEKTEQSDARETSAQSNLNSNSTPRSP